MLMIMELWSNSSRNIMIISGRGLAGRRSVVG
jgi:hypothetical protein